MAKKWVGANTIKSKLKKLNAFIAIFQKRVGKANISSTSIVIAFYLLLSLVPLIIFLGNILPLFQIDPDTILTVTAQIFPTYINQTISPIVRSVLTQTNGGLISFGAIGTLWAISKGINALRLSFNEIYEVEKDFNPFINRIISVLLTIVFLIAIALLIFSFSFGQGILKWVTPILNLSPDVVLWFNKLKWPVAFLTFILTMIIVYSLLPGVRIKLRMVVPGAIFTSISWLLLSQAFAIIVRFFVGTVRNYGTLGTFIIILFWLQYTGYILILGAVINASLEEMIYGGFRQSNTLLTRYSFLRKNKNFE